MTPIRSSRRQTTALPRRTCDARIARRGIRKGDTTKTRATRRRQLAALDWKYSRQRSTTVTRIRQVEALIIENAVRNTERTRLERERDKRHPVQITPAVWTTTSNTTTTTTAVWRWVS